MLISVQDIGGIAHQMGAVEQQFEATGGQGVQRRARHGEHFAPLVQRAPRGDQRAAAGGGLDHHRAARQARR